MTCTSARFRSSRMFCSPRPPAPTRATLTFSLGGTKRGPPSTWRGRMLNAVTAVAAVLMKERRVEGVIFMGRETERKPAASLRRRFGEENLFFGAGKGFIVRKAVRRGPPTAAGGIFRTGTIAETRRSESPEVNRPFSRFRSSAFSRSGSRQASRRPCVIRDHDSNPTLLATSAASDVRAKIFRDHGRNNFLPQIRRKIFRRYIQ